MASRSVYPVKVVVYQPALSKKFSAQGDAARYLGAKMRRFNVLAVSMAPVRTGELKRSIRAQGTLQSGPYAASSKLVLGASHAGYVVFGTTGPIRSRSRHKMPVPDYMSNGLPRRAGGTGPFVFATSVRGQRANDFVERAAARAFTRTRVTTNISRL